MMTSSPTPATTPSPAFPSPDEISLPGRVLFRSGLSAQIPGAALRLGEGALTTDNWYGWLGDESQNPPHWPTSKSTGTWDSTALDYTFYNVNTTKINGKFLKDLFLQFITTGETPVITIINENLSKTVYGPNADFADLEAAYAWLSQRTISTLGSVKLIFPATKITETKSYVINHPNGDRIQWIGADLNQNIPSPTTFQISGNGVAQQAADTTVNLALLRTCFRTEINFTGGNCIIFSGNCGLMKNILFTGDQTPGPRAGLTFSGSSAVVQNIACVGFDIYGLQVTANGSLQINPGSAIVTLGNGGGGFIISVNSLCGATYGTLISLSNGGKHVNDFPGAGLDIQNNSLYGSYPLYAGQSSTTVYVAGNSHHGISLSASVLGGEMQVTTKNNVGVGIAADSGSRINVSGGIANNNGLYGLYANGLSYAYIPNWTIQNNASIGIQASSGAIVVTAGSAVNNNPVNCSPPVGTTGNSNALIV